MHMFGGEVEHDGPSKAEVTASSTSTYSTSAAASQGKAEDEPHESAKPGSSRARNEERVCSCACLQTTAATEEMRKLRIADMDFSFKETCFLLGDVCQLTANTSGVNTALRTMGEGQLEDHCCAHLWAPEGVVNPGVMVTINYAVILEGPFVFPEGYRRVSSVLFLQCDNPTQLQKELTIRLHHWAGKESGLCFMKADHELGSGKSRYDFRRVEGGDFDLDSKSGTICLKDHFCLLCIAIDGSKNRSSNEFYAAFCHNRDQEFRICIAYAVPSWKEAIKAYYWKDSGEDALTFQYRTFTCQEKDGAHVYLSAPTLTEAAPGVGWQCSVLQKKVYLKKLAIENLRQSHKCDQTEMIVGIYPPSLKFKINYDYGKNEKHRQRQHTVLLMGCDEGEEVCFETIVFEPPASPLDLRQDSGNVSSTACSPIEEVNQDNVGAVKLHRAATGGKKVTQRDAEPELPMPRPISDGQSNHEGLEPIHEDSNFDGAQTPERDESISAPVAESERGSKTDPMKKWNRNALIALTAELKENVIMNYGLEDKLQKAADGFMSEGEAQGVKSKHTSAEQMGALISILIGKSDADFGTFCMMLKAANYEVWANKLEEKARELKEESGKLPPSHRRYVPNPSFSMPGGSTVHQTMPCTEGMSAEAAKLSDKSYTARAQTTPACI